MGLRLPRDQERKVLAACGLVPAVPPVLVSRQLRAPKGLVVPSVTVEILVPLHVDTGYVQRAGHWTARYQRSAAAKRAWAAAVVPMPPVCPLVPPLTVTLTRLGGRMLDDDNLKSSCKHIRDQVARWIGRDDADPLVAWNYGQELGGLWGVRVRIETGSERCQQ